MNYVLNYILSNNIEPLSKEAILNIVTFIEFESEYSFDEKMYTYTIKGKNWNVKFSIENINKDNGLEDIIIHTEFFPITDKYKYLHFSISKSRLYEDTNMYFLNLEKESILKSTGLLDS